MNDIVSTANLPALRQIYDVIAKGAAARDADRVHPHDALTLLRQVRFGALLLPMAEGGGGGTLRDVMEEAIYLADRVVVMSPGPGRIVAEECITLERPRDVSSPQFNDIRRHLAALLHADHTREAA